MINELFASLDSAAFRKGSPARAALVLAENLYWDLPDPESLAEAMTQSYQVLQISQMHMDSYNLVAQFYPDREVALDLFQKAAGIGDKLWGKRYFRENMGYFWGIMETRPYMRALYGTMEIYRDKGDLENAISIGERMLKLCVNDNMGVRHVLISALIEKSEITKAEALYRLYEGDYSAQWFYSRALLDFLKHGDSKVANKSLDEAFNYNAHVPRYLIGAKKLPAHLPFAYQWGSDEEAVLYAADASSTWRKTKELFLWLVERFALTKESLI